MQIGVLGLVIGVIGGLVSFLIGYWGIGAKDLWARVALGIGFGATVFGGFLQYIVAQRAERSLRAVVNGNEDAFPYVDIYFDELGDGYFRARNPSAGPIPDVSFTVGPAAETGRVGLAERARNFSQISVGAMPAKAANIRTRKLQLDGKRHEYVVRLTAGRLGLFEERIRVLRRNNGSWSQAFQVSRMDAGGRSTEVLNFADDDYDDDNFDRAGLP